MLWEVGWCAFDTQVRLIQDTFNDDSIQRRPAPGEFEQMGLDEGTCGLIRYLHVDRF
jgi:hypothetical protein